MEQAKVLRLRSVDDESTFRVVALCDDSVKSGAEVRFATEWQQLIQIGTGTMRPIELYAVERIVMVD